MAKNIPFFLGCLLGTEVENPKAIHPYDAAMGLWNLALEEDTREAIVEAGDVIPSLVDLVVKGNAGEATAPCIGVLEAMSLTEDEDTKAMLQKTVITLVSRFEEYSQDHSAAETKTIYGLLSNLARSRRNAAVQIAERMLKPDLLRNIKNWVDKDLQAASVNFLAALSFTPELHPRLIENLSLEFAVKIMQAKRDKRAAHAALEYVGELAKTDEYRDEVFQLITNSGVEAMEWLSKVGTEKDRSKVAEVIWGIVKDPPKVKLFRKTVPSLAALLKSEDVEIVKAVTATLWFMAYDDPVCMSLGACGAAEDLAKHASSKDDKVRLQATGVLRNMSQHASLLKMIEAAGCPSHLVNLWKPLDDVKAEIPSNARPKFPAISLNMI